MHTVYIICPVYFSTSLHHLSCVFQYQSSSSVLYISVPVFIICPVYFSTSLHHLSCVFQYQSSSSVLCISIPVYIICPIYLSTSIHHLSCVFRHQSTSSVSKHPGAFFHTMCYKDTSHIVYLCPLDSYSPS